MSSQAQIYSFSTIYTLVSFQKYSLQHSKSHRTRASKSATKTTTMAWRCTGNSNRELITNMANSGILRSEEAIKAMSHVDRVRYVKHPSTAYEDCPQTIGYGATISAPHMHAYAIEHLLPYLRPGAKVLDVGSGSGYLTAVLYHLVGPTGKVVGIDHIPELVDWSVENLRKDGLGEALDKGQIVMVAGDGRKGYKEGGPYDAIHVGAASPQLPSELIAQLKSPGRIFVPVGTYAQYIEHIDKDEDGNVTHKQVMGVSYVPLTDEYAQRSVW
ncbi:Protein-L-isoaspartate(D-aspartate) O-methyltransferase [Hypsizygus marmoreus]|uniref:Protein-L-isoaspartate O-methyltransferase n=1 Tax=Hypsizygus marmoreus TaxID=39966 RepID=A0A369K848_HYPMA|nr:Protein-L-isoaspartate(D-aspartate) O-methyltransferase [Hypsizygus marmoreus]